MTRPSNDGGAVEPAGDAGPSAASPMAAPGPATNLAADLGRHPQDQGRGLWPRGVAWVRTLLPARNRKQ